MSSDLYTFVGAPPVQNKGKLGALLVIKKSSGSHKVAAFADDLIFFLTEPLTSLPNLLQSLQEYGALSLFKINLSKSSLLNITVGKDIVLLRSEYPLRWETNTIHYLGVDITSDALQPVSGELHTTTPPSQSGPPPLYSLTLTWFGRCNALKMTVLSRVLDLLQALPIRLPLVFFKPVDYVPQIRLVPS